MRYGDLEHNIILLVKKAVSACLAAIGKETLPASGLQIELEIPKEKSHGDISTNIAMKLCKSAGMAPIDFAGLIAAKIPALAHDARMGQVISRVEAKTPGFINFFLSDDYLSKVILEIKRKRGNFGKSGMGRGLNVQVEFVSANPTGPLTIAHGRQAAIGDSLAGILGFLGYRVTKEYYLNDEGTQMEILGRSIRARYLELCGACGVFPEDGYRGSYINEIAKDFKKKYGKKFVEVSDAGAFREFGLKWILDDIRKDLKDFGVKFNTWYSQKSLRKSGRVERAIRYLKKKGHIYEKEGAVWFRSTEFGDDKDRVVVKSDSTKTYLAPDIAYHLEKYRRGFRKIIDIWGPDHHGYIPRMKAAIKALGFSEDSLSVLIVQLATLYRAGRVVSMSTRAGEFVTVREVMDEVGKDVTRFVFLSRRLSSHLDFDLDSVKKESMENPVYYIQYAHARIWSILEYGRKAHAAAMYDRANLNQPEEIELMRSLRQFPAIVALSGRQMEPHVILQHLQELAALFHSFYNKHRVVSDDIHLTKSRLVLVDCVRIVLANGLRLLGVSFPKKM
jgi:arginyl-tRNA synthetase